MFYESISRLSADTVVLGTRDWQQIPALRERVMGRVVGVVIAHEVGHVLLRSREHAPRGLMRPLLHTSELVDPSRDRFALTVTDVARLRAVWASAEAIAALP